MAGSGGGRVFGGGDSASLGGVFLQNQRISSSSSSSSQPLEAFFISGSSSSFFGSSSMVTFEDVCGGKKPESSFRLYDWDDNGDEDFDDYFHQPEKKRRLTVEQVKFLEKSFELENKLEPERKVQLAKELGLQPRQVGIWFQNRRARWKTKQLEKDFDALQASYDSLKADYDNVLKENEKLQAEVIHLTDKLNLKQKEHRERSNSSNMYNQSKTDQQEPVIDSTSEIEDAHVSIFPSKQEDHLTSAKSDVLEYSDSSHYANGGYSAAIEDPGDSSYAFEGDHSDISQDDQDYLGKTLLPSSQAFAKIEDSCNFDLPSEDHDPSPVLWPYWDVNLRM